ncbi:hypothetical protein M9Y10_013375 [Tritrichomonas musculus]|uniref:DnaJ domain containing protein n=1 Tax=Tritrichomonas musculus TaxID=1915356 RepID=A0ABR2I824_9EUKA
MNDSSAIHDRTDYYELFGVEETATQDQLKKAYRKAAMRWHPDRNHDNITEATRVFQIIEHAYSILSDPHERAWYDGHRHAVVNELGEFSATNVDIEGLFSAGAFTGFNDGPNGFYAVFQDAFRSLSEEESSTAKFPLFGDSNSPYEKVTEFYNFWTCFTTKRSFAFKDIYRLKDAPNGRYKRAMNQENEKVRQKAQREFVQSVRELALFAKKRDPRVKKHLEEVERQNEEKRKIAEKKKLERQKEVEKQLQSILNDNSNPISYNENDIIYLKEFDKEETEPQWHCDYCGRDMNTESAFKQHCNTKKHKKLSATARKDFLADPSLFEHTKYTFLLLGLTDHEIQAITGKTADEFLNAQTEPNKEGDLDNEEEEEPEFDSKSKKGKKQNQKKKQQNKDDDDLDNETASNTKKGKQNKKQNQNQKNKKNINDDDDDNDNDENDEDDDDEDEFQNKGKNKNNQGKKGKGNNNNNKNQNQNKNNQQKIPKKEKHKQKMQRQKEAREKAELEELEKQRQKEREEKEKIESIISKSQSSDIITDNENENENENENNSVNSSNSNFGPKLSKKEKKRLRQLEEARKRLLIQEAEEEEEEEKKENDEKGEVEDLAPQIEEVEEDKAESNENIQQNEEAKKKDEKVIEIIDENGQKVKVTLTDNFDDVEEKDDDQAEDQAQNQTQNQKNQNQPKGKNKKGNKGPKRPPPGMFMCRKCHAVFPSKTKLFKHLEETNHATAYG